MGYLARFRASLLKICCFKTAGRFDLLRKCAWVRLFIRVSAFLKIIFPNAYGVLGKKKRKQRPTVKRYYRPYRPASFSLYVGDKAPKKQKSQ